MRLWDSPLRNVRAAAVLAWALSVGAFFNAPANEFAFDDNFVVQGNTAIHSLDGLLPALAKPYWPGTYGEGRAIWRPASTAILGLEWVLFDGNPVGFHVVNVLLHSCATVLVVLLLGELLPTAGALVGGLLFSVHPVHVEAVANVVGLSELLATVLFLLACLLTLRAGVSMGPGRTAAVLGLFLFAFLAKESAVTLPGVVLLLDSSRADIGIRDLGGYLARRWPLYGGMVAVGGLVLLVRHHALGGLSGPFPPLGATLLQDIPRIWTVAGSWPHLFRLLLFPLDLSSDYGPAVIPLEFGWNATNLTGLVLVLGILGSALVSWRTGALSREDSSARAFGWGVVWVAITLAPTSNFFFLSGILLAERTLYLPSVGVGMIAGWVYLRLRAERPRVAPVLLALTLALAGARTWTRTPAWKNNTEVFQTLMADHPEAGRSQWVLGDSYLAIGQTRPGLRAYGAALGILRGHYSVSMGVARQLMALGHDSAAELLLKNAWEERPGFGVAPGLLAQIYDRQGRVQDSREAAQYSIDRDPADALQHWILSRALRAQGHLKEAETSARNAIQRAESGRVGLWIGVAEIQLEMGDSAAAKVSLDSARVWVRSPLASRRLDSILAGLGAGPE